MHIITVAITFIAILSILVIVHEWGHFIVARLFKIRVDEFSLGFGPRALRIGKLGDTEYNIRWIPMGGFVRIAGMEVDEAPVMYAAEKMAAARSGIKVTDEELEKHPPIEEPAPPKEDIGQAGFFAHPVWQRALVIFAGPFMSFALGYFIIFGMTLTVGLPTGDPTNKVDSVNVGSEADHMGLKSGDIISAINGKHVTTGQPLITIIHNSTNKPVTLLINRSGKMLSLTGTPRRTVQPDGEVTGALGFLPAVDISKVQRVGMREAFHDTNAIVMDWLGHIGSLFVHHNLKELRTNMGGPIYIAQATSQAVTQGGDSIPIEMAMITMSLAIFNLLPIPILDGGYLLMFLVEAIRRGKRLTFQEQQNFMLAGLAVIGVLFVFIMFNDVARAIHPLTQ